MKVNSRSREVSESKPEFIVEQAKEKLRMYKRPLKNILSVFFKKQFYTAFFNIYKNFDRPIEILWRYVFRKGEYPEKFIVKTPLGKHEVRLYSSDDMMTLVECFGKLDYPTEDDISCVVDFGSNIGVSAGYFLTRNKILRHTYSNLFPKILRN